MCDFGGDRIRCLGVWRGRVDASSEVSSALKVMRC